jgi:hypothetical protein
MENTSTLTKRQVREYGPKPISGYGNGALIKAKVRYDDECGNGHNSFAITGEIYIPRRSDCEACGMLHDEIARVFPELKPLLKWHLCSSDGPMHYVENTLYWVGKRGWCDGKPGSPPNLAYARNAAIWPDATDEQIANVTEEQLRERLPALLSEFRAAVESLGFVF